MCSLTANCDSFSPGHLMSVPAWLAIIALLLSGALTGCGHAAVTESPRAHDSATSEKSSSRTATTGAPGTTSSKGKFKTDSDGDNDNPTGSHYDTDDNFVLSYGHAASVTDMLTISRIVKRYYRAAAAGDGAKGCSLVYSVLAEAAPEDLSRSPRAGESCAEALSSFFKRNRRQFKADTVRIGVTRVRVEGSSGLVLVRLGIRERRVLVHREEGTWKVNTLLDEGVP
jgi:hypothetical protein